MQKNEILSLKFPKSDFKLKSTSEAINLQTSILDKNNKVFQRYKDSKKNLSHNNSSILSDKFFNQLPIPLTSSDKIGMPTLSHHSKFNKSLNSLKEMSSLPSMYNKTKLTSNINDSLIYSPNSRLKEINFLKEENKILKNQLNSKKTELQEVDEFKIAMKNIELSSTDFNEKRINCLKGQLLKQQKYIKKLEKTFKLMKIFHEDSKNFMMLFIEISSKYQDKFKFKRQTKISTNIDANLQRMDSDVFKDAVEKLIKGFKNQEVFKEFIDNFNNAYKMILDYERPNEEFQSLFKSKQPEKIPKTQKIPLEYQNPITAFVCKYKQFFNIKTVLDVIEPKETEKISMNFENLLVLNKKVEDLFLKLNTMDNFKNNIFFMSRKNEPFISEENYKSFEDFLIENTQTHYMGLNYNEIMNLESKLAGLLNDLVYFEYDFLYQKEEITLNKLHNLQEKIRKNIQMLIELGIRLSDTDNANLLYILQKSLFDERESLKTSEKKDDYLLLVADKSDEIKRDFANCCIYIKDFMITLPESVLADETQQKKVKKMDFLVDIIIAIFEEKETFNQILELDLKKQKETIELLKDGISEIQIYFEQKNNTFNKYMLEMQTKLFDLSAALDILADNKNDTFFKRMKKKFDEILEFFSKIPYENPSEKRIKGKRLFEEYELKFEVLLSKWKGFQNKLANIKSKFI